MFRFLSIALGVVFIAFVVLLSVGNTKEVTVVLLPFAYDATVPMYFLVMFISVLSFILGGTFMWLHSLSKYWQHRKKEKAKTAEKIQEITNKVASEKDASLKIAGKN